MPVTRIDLDDTALLIIDLQEKLMPVIHDQQQITEQTVRLIQAMHLFGMPTLITEQYPKGLGSSIPAIREALDPAVQPVEKTRFSALVPAIAEQLVDRNIHSLILAGVEAHVCLMQTALDLIDAGYQVFPVVDAIGSRNPVDRKIALQRLEQAGAVLVTVEMLIFECMADASAPIFKQIRPLLRK